MNMCLFVSPVSRWPNDQYIVNSSFMIPTFSNFKLPYGFRWPIAYEEEGVRKHADGTDRLQVFHENCWFVCKFINFHGSWSKLQMGWVPWYWKGSTYSILGVLCRGTLERQYTRVTMELGTCALFYWMNRCVHDFVYLLYHQQFLFV